MYRKHKRAAVGKGRSTHSTRASGARSERLVFGLQRGELGGDSTAGGLEVRLEGCKSLVVNRDRLGGSNGRDERDGERLDEIHGGGGATKDEPR